MDRVDKSAKVSVPFLIEADTAAAAAVDERISTAFSDPKDQRRVRAYLSNPVFRPLFELFLNGATSLAGARVLLAGGFVETEQYTVRLGHLAGYSMQSVRITKAGGYEIDEFSPSSEKDTVFNQIEAAILSYVAIDHGAGIVARRELIDFAIDYCDSEILLHLVELHSGRRQHDGLPFDTIVTEEERLEDADYWSGFEDGRCGAAFVDLSKLSQSLAAKRST